MASFLTCALSLLAAVAVGVDVPASPPDESVAVSKYLNSFSIEFRDFPTFAGTVDSPNQFSVNLLQNLANRTGVMPKIRVGGSTQDDVVFVPGQSDAVITHGEKDGTNRPLITIGPSFYSSYGSFPGASYIAGITLAVNGSNGTETRQSEAKSIQQALGSNLAAFEIGNEPDLYSLWHRRSSSWGASAYVKEWKAASDIVGSATGDNVPYSGPSFAGTRNTASGDALAPLPAFQHGLNDDGNIKEIFGHNYMAGASDSGVSLQDTLMNHASVVKSISGHVSLAQNLQQYCDCPYIMGETNSLSGGGAGGLSDVFGAALWVVDYALYQATQNIQRVQFHQSNGSPYAAWAPDTSSPKTNAPYYGNLMVAAAVGSDDDVQVSYLDLGNDDDHTSAYVFYTGDKLVRMAILNMNEYDSNGDDRGSQTFSLNVPDGINAAQVERLTADGADVTSGVTFAGVSYDYSPNQGQPHMVNGTAETISTGDDGTLSIKVQDTEGVVLHFM